jgi:hypothetical protein
MDVETRIEPEACILIIITPAVHLKQSLLLIAYSMETAVEMWPL